MLLIGLLALSKCLETKSEERHEVTVMNEESELSACHYGRQVFFELWNDLLVNGIWGITVKGKASSTPPSLPRFRGLGGRVA